MRVVHFRTTLAALSALACSSAPLMSGGGTGGAPNVAQQPGAGGSAPTVSGFGSGGDAIIDVGPALPWPGAPCDPSRTVKSDGRALLIRDPEVLALFPLEKVLAQIIKTGTATATTPIELLVRLFDTENDTAGSTFTDGVHCDQSNAAFVNGKAVQCPRAEGRLAKSTGFFTEGDPDSFVPIALMNRIDLMPTNFATCGEYRIVYAKQSGFTDPTNRLFLIFEAALPNAGGGLPGCRPVAELWAGLETSAPDVVERTVETFFFEGSWDGHGFEPAVHARHYGDQGSCSYAGACGQLRVGQGMQAPWEFRQFRFQSTPGGARFAPVSLSSSLRPEVFDPTAADSSGDVFRSTFFTGHLGNLGGAVVPRVRLTDTSPFEAGESALAGPAMPSFAASLARSPAGAAFKERIAAKLLELEPGACPSDDPLTADSIVDRAAALSCAGCHAPETVLSAGGKVGCGVTWPKGLGETHIDERGALSEALTNVFLPYRAGVLGTYLQACDAGAIVDNLQPAPPDIRIECFVAGTPITMADGSTEAIERVKTGDLVLTFDERTHALAPGRVQRTVVRRDADHLVNINGELVATDNHPFRTTRGWVRAGELRIGDGLVRARNLGAAGGGRFEMQPAEVRELAMQPGTVDTYNLDVAVTHSYFAGGFLVHDRP